RLVVLGLSPGKTVWVLYVLASVGSLVAISMQRFPDQAMPLFGLFALILLLSGVYLGHVKVKSLDYDKLTPSWTPLVTNTLYKKGLAEIALDTLLTVLCFYSAYLLRFDGDLDPGRFSAVMTALPVVVICCL